MSERTTGDTVGGGGIGAVIGFGVGGPLGALIGGAIGGLIGGKNIVKGAASVVASQAGRLSRDSRFDSEQRDKLKTLADNAEQARKSIK